MPHFAFEAYGYGFFGKLLHGQGFLPEVALACGSSDVPGVVPAASAARIRWPARRAARRRHAIAMPAERRGPAEGFEEP